MSHRLLLPVALMVQITALTWVCRTPELEASPVSEERLESASPSQFPGGVLDPTGRAVYVSSTSGGIEALDLITGDVLWQSVEAQLPLLVQGDRLYAQAGVKRNRLRVLAFDLNQKGEAVFESDPLVLPNWVVTANAPGRTWRTTWRMERSALHLHWQAEALLPGARPLPQRQDRQQAQGGARFDLTNGQVQQSSAASLPAATPFTFPRQLERRAVRWYGLVNNQPRAVLLEAGKTKAEATLQLLGWDPAKGTIQGPVALLSGHRPIVLASTDHQHLFVRETAPPEDAERVAPLWNICEALSGKALARAPFFPGTEAGVVRYPWAYFLVNGAQIRELRAVDLRSGKAAWRRTLALGPF